ncbi:hypothetical protein QWZ08_25020 [Ferruginibacter paludis]|uniref:hypothetical protein n=1 Tax=Ferruginibacter paludis TaxID=1310417 RepID=UPI0025B5AE2A|nr:hypothetical protein [Ferruginibacter paludis]MDN3658930.1 hypothetical protein [Ferruginibacter paludis]
MTLTEAFTELINSDEFKNIAKEKDAAGSKYRVYLSRFKSGQLKIGAIAELLIKHGYTVEAFKNKAAKAAKKKK